MRDSTKAALRRVESDWARFCSLIFPQLLIHLVPSRARWFALLLARFLARLVFVPISQLLPILDALMQRGTLLTPACT